MRTNGVMNRTRSVGLLAVILLGCVIILSDKLGAWGQVELAPL